MKALLQSHTVREFRIMGMRRQLIKHINEYTLLFIKKSKANMPKGWILCCVKKNMKGKVMSQKGDHCYEVFLDSPIGQALERASGKDQKYVLLSDVEGYKDMNAFKEIKSPGFHNLLNVGKEWVFRDIFSTGCEVVSNKTGATMQSFQTRLKKIMPKTPEGELITLDPVFQIVTHVTGCRGGKCYACKKTRPCCKKLIIMNVSHCFRFFFLYSRRPQPFSPCQRK